MEGKFKGFSIPNFIQTPPEFFDLLIYDRDLTCAELRLLGFMIRATYGWQRKGYSIEISLTDLEKYLGFGRSTANRAIKTLLERGYIERLKIEGTENRYKYRLKLNEEDEKNLDVTWDNMFNWKRVFEEPEGKTSKKKTDQSHDETTQYQDETSQFHDETTQSHIGTTQIQNETENSFIMEPAEDHYETSIGITTKPVDKPSALTGQGFGSSLNKTINISNNKDNKNKDFDDDEDDECTIMCKKYFISEVVEKLKLPQAFYDKILNEIDWSMTTPIVAQRASIKFRKAFKMGQITSNPFIWFKTTLENEEVIYANEFYNMKDWAAE